MLVGCYVTHLYCDWEGCMFEMGSGMRDPIEITGVSLADCIRQYKNLGWTVSKREGNHYCPDHCKANRAKLKQK